MPESVEAAAADLLGPRGGPLDSDQTSRITAQTITTSTVVHDLSDATHFGNISVYLGKFVCIEPEGANIYYFWTDDSGAVVDEAAVGGTNRVRQCCRIVDGDQRQQRAAARYLAIKGSGSGTVRIAVMQSD